MLPTNLDAKCLQTTERLLSRLEIRKSQERATESGVGRGLPDPKLAKLSRRGPGNREQQEVR